MSVVEADGIPLFCALPLRCPLSPPEQAILVAEKEYNA